MLGSAYGRGRDDADAQRADEGIARPLACVEQRVGIGEQAAGALDDVLPGRGDEHATAIALEQPHAEHALELRELGAQRRLRHAALCCRPPERGLVRDRDGVLELPKAERMGGRCMIAVRYHTLRRSDSDVEST